MKLLFVSFNLQDAAIQFAGIADTMCACVCDVYKLDWIRFLPIFSTRIRAQRRWSYNYFLASLSQRDAVDIFAACILWFYVRKIDLPLLLRRVEWVGVGADVAAVDDILVLNANHYCHSKSVDFRIGRDFVRAWWAWWSLSMSSSTKTTTTTMPPTIRSSSISACQLCVGRWHRIRRCHIMASLLHCRH